MTTKKIKFTLGAFLIVGSIGYLISTSISQTSMYFVTVAELTDQGLSRYTSELKVKGNVVKGSIVRDPNDYLKVDFAIADKESKGSNLKVHFKGVTPDMFQDDGEVVVEGVIKNGVFHANTLLTSCPSKYEAEKQAGKSHPGSVTPYELKKPDLKDLGAGTKTTI
jgi:cytochrome c-type biogenesis protein CcmE